MRKILKDQCPAPTVLTAADSIGVKETQKAISAYKLLLETASTSASRASRKAAVFDFKAYKHPSVRAGLEQIFKGKCAYCECRYASIHPVDIEHWRPKKEVVIGDGVERRYGYYWLAADWGNLMPSCIDCNRVRVHTDLDGQKRTLGKGNWFPVLDENKRDFEPASFGEQPLLINPCIDNPDDYLLFHEEGFISAKPGISELDRLRANASIRFYALNRSELVSERRSRLLLIKQRMLTISALANLMDQPAFDDQLHQVVEDLISHELRLLHVFREADQPFSSMAKQFIEEFVKSFKPKRARNN